MGNIVIESIVGPTGTIGQPWHRAAVTRPLLAVTVTRRHVATRVRPFVTLPQVGKDTDLSDQPVTWSLLT